MAGRDTCATANTRRSLRAAERWPRRELAHAGLARRDVTKTATARRRPPASPPATSASARLGLGHRWLAPPGCCPLSGRSVSHCPEGRRPGTWRVHRRRARRQGPPDHPARPATPPGRPHTTCANSAASSSSTNPAGPAATTSRHTPPATTPPTTPAAPPRYPSPPPAAPPTTPLLPPRDHVTPPTPAGSRTPPYGPKPQDLDRRRPRL